MAVTGKQVNMRDARSKVGTGEKLTSFPLVVGQRTPPLDTSMNGGKGVLDEYTSDPLPIVQIFREDPSRAAFGSS